MSHKLDAEFAAYAARVAKALEPVAKADLNWGHLYVTEVQLGFEGEAAPFKLVPDELGEQGFDIEIVDSL